MSATPPIGPEQVTDGPWPDWRRPFLVQLAIAILIVTALQAMRPMVTYRAIALGAGTLEIGLVQSAFSLVPVFTAVPLGRWVDRVGEARFIAVAMALFGVGSGILLISDTLIGLAVGLLVAGFGQIINLVAGQAMIANRGPRGEREYRFGWYATTVSLGQLAGPAIGAALVAGIAFEGNAQAPVFAFSVALSVTAGLLALFLPHRRPMRAQAGPEGRAPGLQTAVVRVFRRPGMAAAMLVSITVISAVDVLVAYLPAYGELNGLSVGTVGALLSVRAASSLVSRALMGRMIALMGREWLLATSMALAGGGIVLLPFVASEPILFGLMVLIGLGLGLGQPMTIAWVANRSPRAERGLALGVRVTGNRAALLVVPTIMGAIAGAGGLSAIWVVMAALLGLGAVVARRTPFDELAAEGSHGKVSSG